MFAADLRYLLRIRVAFIGLRRPLLRVVLALIAAQAALVGLLAAVAEIRKRREGLKGSFPWSDMPEIELESGDDRLKLYPYGVKLYEAMLDEIEGAKEKIFLETFIWKGDALGRRFVSALERKAKEGVQVYVTFDGFANLIVPPSFKRFPKEIHTFHFRPFSEPPRALDPRNIFRDHRKILAVDGRVAFMGGFNIGSLFATDWRDTHLRIRGAEVHELENAFIAFWNAHRTEDLPFIEPVHERAWNPAAILHRNDPFMRIFPVRGMYLEAIDRASSHIYLTHAYFIPDRAMRAGLLEAAKRGVDVQILLPRHSNHNTADWLAKRHFGTLLRAGVRIFGYEQMIHSKTATIDGIWSTIGTANIDRLSLLGNYEINLEIYSHRLAAQMERMFEVDKTHAKEITLEEWERRPLSAKLAERALATLSPLV
ncbi:MAG: phospholipase D-like domain-containing protein [Actinomycetota bacterium]|nr:phospholipase D-like domain-containing protein [Actinomycetota bacterium]